MTEGNWLHYFSAEEPQQCERKDCKEEFNGLHTFHKELAEGFDLSINLCNKHSKEFEEKVLKTVNSLVDESEKDYFDFEKDFKKHWKQKQEEAKQK